MVVRVLGILGKGMSGLGLIDCNTFIEKDPRPSDSMNLD